MIPDTVGFRPNAEDKRILEQYGSSPTDTIRAALRLLDHEMWLEQFREDALRLRDENLDDEIVPKPR